MSFRSGASPARRSQLPGWSLWKLHRKLGRPGDLGILAHKTKTAHAGLHKTVVLVEHCRVTLELDPEHQLLALLGGLDTLGRELRLGRHEADGGGNDIFRNRSQEKARFGAT